MIEVFSNILPILAELDELPAERPVMINALLMLFEKHTHMSIQLVGSKLDPAVAGFHISSSKTKKALIFYSDCHLPYIKTCTECQRTRLTIVKELIHTTDKKPQKTLPNKAAYELIFQLIGKKLLSDDGMVDLSATICAGELLVPYITRKTMKGSFAYTKHCGGGDFSHLAAQYGVPEPLTKQLFSDDHMEMMRILRQNFGLKI